VSNIEVERLARVFVEVADTLIDDFDVIEFLQTVTARSAELAHASAAGLLLADQDNHLRFTAASDEVTKLLELFQVQAREGPCFDAFHTGQAVIHADLGDASVLWPRFTPRAIAAGFASVHAFPLRLRSQVIGALNIFGDSPGRMDEGDADIIQALADVATIGILQERDIRQGERLTEQLQGALNSRVVIEQAKGVLAQVHGITVDEAFERLRTQARNRGVKLSDLARRIVSDPSAESAWTVDD